MMFVFFVISFASTFFYTSEGLSPLPPASCESYEEPNDEIDDPTAASSFASATASASSSSSSSPSPNGSCVYDRCIPTCSIPNPSNCSGTLTTNGNCTCESGYILSEKGGKCVKYEECQKYSSCNGDRNAFFTTCPNPCGPTCSNPNVTPCKRLCLRYGCQCKANYVRSDEGKCILPTECPGSCEHDRCIPTCSIPNPSNCSGTLTTNGNCTCESGYILSEKGGKCVKYEECQKYSSCNGDPNAFFKTCPNPCGPTCSKPNVTPCNKMCLRYGCQCKPLYLRSDEGKCISPTECPGGDPCGQNKTFVYCSVKCPTDFCPADDSRAMIACDPPYPCPSGCSCQQNYKLERANPDRCILASDCPPVNCTRQNEVWNSCPPPCLRESCRDLNEPPPECYRSGVNCQPQCVCQDGYRRNSSDVCIPTCDCTSDA